MQRPAYGFGRCKFSVPAPDYSIKAVARVTPILFAPNAVSRRVQLIHRQHYVGCHATGPEASSRRTAQEAAANEELDAGEEKPDAELMAGLMNKGKRMATEVGEMRKAAAERAAIMKALQVQKEAEAIKAAHLKRELDEAEAEVENLKDQVAHSQALDQRCQLQAEVIQDLRDLNQLARQEAEVQAAHFEELEAALDMALEEVTTTDKDIVLLQARQKEISQLQSKLAAKDETLGSLAGEVEELHKKFEEDTAKQVKAKNVSEHAEAKVARIQDDYKKLEAEFEEFRRTRSRGQTSTVPSAGSRLAKFQEAEFTATDSQSESESEREEEHPTSADATTEVNQYKAAVEMFKQQVLDGKKELVRICSFRDDANAAAVSSKKLLEDKLAEVTEALSTKEAEMEPDVKNVKDTLELQVGKTEKAEQEAKRIQALVDTQNNTVKKLDKELKTVRSDLDVRSSALLEVQSACSSLQTDLRDSLKELQVARKELSESRQEVEDQAEALTSTQKELAAAQKVIDEKDVSIEDLHAKVLQIRGQTMKLEGDLQTARESSGTSGKSLRELESELYELQQNHGTSLAETLTLKQRLETAERAAEKQKKVHATEVYELENSLKNERAVAESMQQQLMDVAASVADMKRDIAHKETHLKDVETKLGKSSLSAQQLEQELKTLRSEVGLLKKREDGWSAELEDTANVTSQLIQKLQQMDKEATEKDQELASARADAQQAQAMTEGLLISADETTALLQELESLQARVQFQDSDPSAAGVSQSELQGEVHLLQDVLTDLQTRSAKATRELSNEKQRREDLKAEAQVTRNILNQAEQLAASLKMQLAAAQSNDVDAMDDSLNTQEAVEARELAGKSAEAARLTADQLEKTVQWLKNEVAGIIGDEVAPASSDGSQGDGGLDDMAADSETAHLRAEVARLKEELKKEREVGVAVSSASSPEASAAVLKVMQSQNKRLRDGSVRTGAILDKSAKFANKYIDKSAKMLKNAGIQQDRLDQYMQENTRESKKDE